MGRGRADQGELGVQAGARARPAVDPEASAQGLDAAVARRLAAQTLAGAGRMVAAEAAPDLAAMRAAVTSKGGTTAAALARFDALGLPAMVAEAMRAAVARSQELARQSGD